MIHPDTGALRPLVPWRVDEKCVVCGDPAQFIGCSDAHFVCSPECEELYCLGIRY